MVPAVQITFMICVTIITLALIFVLLAYLANKNQK